MISIRRRLILGIMLLLSAVWLIATAWAVLDMRQELQTVLDARLASSARMVQTLLERGEVPRQSPVPPPSVSELADMTTDARLTCQLWSLDGELMSLSRGAPVVSAPQQVPDGYSNRVINGERWRLFALTAPDSGIRVLTAERRDLRRALVADVALAVSTPFLLALPAMVLLVWYGVGRGLRPLATLRDAIQRRDANALAPIDLRQVPVEVSPLVAALNRLFQRLQDAFARERHFTGDAAHELRTPIAGLKTQIQLARLAEGQQRDQALEQAEAVADRLGRLVQQLLALARLDAEVPNRARNRCHPAAVAEAVVQELSPTAERRRVRLHLDMATDMHAALPEAMLHTALRNLVDNALAASPPEGTVTVTIDGEAGQRIRLGVDDQGPGIAADALPQVTRRFYRGGEGQSPAGSGLGLAIVQAIMDRYGGRLTLCNRSDGSGLQAVLSLPATQEHGRTACQ